MDHSSTRVRVFRVTDDRGPYSITLVIEYVESEEFYVDSRVEVGSPFEIEFSRSANDRSNIFSVLSSLRNHAVYGELGASTVEGHSIDEAVTKAAEDMHKGREFMERWRREHRIGEQEIETSKEKEPPPVASEPLSPGDVSGRSATTIRSVAPSAEESRRMEEHLEQQAKEVWDYARGKRLEWKRVGRTPGGLEYEILTLDGVQDLYPGPTSIDTSSPKGT
ncbi:MAG: hypothetical protein ACREDR_08080 [Blastocatellia bacterium]